GGEDRVAVRGVVGGVDPHAARAALARDGGVDAAVVGGGERERGAREGAAGVRPRDMRDPARGRQRRERGRERGTHHRDHGAGGEEALDLALGDRAAAEDDARPALQLDEQRKQRHGYPSTPAGSRPPAGSRSTAGTGLPASSARSVASSWRAANARNVSPACRLVRYSRSKRSIAGATSVAGTRSPIGRATDWRAPSAPPTQK